MRNRIIASLAALALAVTGGAIALSLGGSAASAAVASSSAPRGWYIDANGLPHFLPMGSYAVPGQSGDYKGMWFKGLTLDPQPVAQRAVADSGIKRDVNVTVNVDFDATVPVKVTGLPAFRAGDPELWGDNTGSMTDAAADIVVKRVATSVTKCDKETPSASRSIGSTEQKFCVYPTHDEPGATGQPGFLKGQSYALNVWVYAP